MEITQKSKIEYLEGKKLRTKTVGNKNSKLKRTFSRANVGEVRFGGQGAKRTTGAQDKEEAQVSWGGPQTQQAKWVPPCKSLVEPWSAEQETVSEKRSSHVPLTGKFLENVLQQHRGSHPRGGWGPEWAVPGRTMQVGWGTETD